MLAISLFGCTRKDDTTTEVNDKDKIRLQYDKADYQVSTSAEQIANEILEAAGDNDKERIMSLFSEYALNYDDNSEDAINQELDKLFDFCSYNIKDIDVITNLSESTHRDGSHLLEIYIKCYFTTDDDTEYFLYSEWCADDTDNPSRVGLYNIGIIRRDISRSYHIYHYGYDDYPGIYVYGYRSSESEGDWYTQEDVELLNQIYYENSDDMKALVSAYATVMDNEDGYCTIYFETPMPTEPHKDDGIKSRQGVMLDKLYDEEFTDASRKMADKGIFCYVGFIKEGDKLEVHFYILPEIVAFSENNNLPNEIIYDDSIDEYEVSGYNYIEENWYSHIMEKPDY